MRAAAATPGIVTRGDLGVNAASFARHVRASNLSPATIRSYLDSIGRFAAFLEEREARDRRRDGGAPGLAGVPVQVLRRASQLRGARGEPPLPIDMTVAATLLYQAHDYFAALYRLPGAVGWKPPAPG